MEVALERLVTLSLVNDLAGGRYGLHPLTRSYVRAALGEGSQVVQAALGRVALDPKARRATLRYWVDYARKYGGSHKDAYQTFDRLENEWPNLEAAASVLRDLVGLPGLLQDEEAARMLNDLARALSTFLRFQGYWDERVCLSEWACEAAKALGDWSNVGWRTYDVAWIHFHRAETDQAAAWADRCTQAMERSGTRPSRAAAIHLRGLITEQQGDIGESERLLTEALAAYRELEEEINEAIVLNDLGHLAQKRRDYDRAEEYYREALALGEKLGDKEGEAVRFGNLGDLAQARGRMAEACRWYERQLALAQEIGRLDQVASAQSGLAWVLEEEDRPAEALPLAEEALRIYERLRDQNLPWTRQLVARLREKAGAGKGGG